MDKLSEQDEKRIMAGLERVITLTNQGEHPDQAIFKIASDEKLSPPIVSRMAEAYNVSKTLSHMKHASGSARAESFKLANPVQILDKMYPAVVETPVSKAAALFKPDEYTRSETRNFNKVAACGPMPKSEKPTPYPRDPSIQERKNYDKREGMKKKASSLLSDARGKFYQVMELAKEAGAYFRQVGHVPFKEVETQVLRAHGELGKTAMDMVYTFGNIKEARAGDVASGMAWYHAGTDPYLAIERLIKVGQEFHTASRVAARAELELSGFEEKIGAVKTASSGLLLDDALGGGPPRSHQVKRAVSDLTGALQQAGTLGLDILGPGAKTEESVRRKTLSEVLDPEHETKLQGLKMKAVLNDFLANDPVLSMHDPHEVATAYNQLAELSPLVAQQPAVVRGMLRRMLQQEGVVEPFEAQQATTIERHLRGMAPDQAMAQTPAIK